MQKTDNLINEFKNSNYVVGIVLAGSATKGYFDDYSDHDYQVIVTDDYYSELDEDSKVIHIDDEKSEFLFLPVSDYYRKIDSCANIDHWPYETSQIIYDNDGKLEDATIQIITMDSEERESKLKLFYFEFIFYATRIDKLIKRNSEFNCLMTMAAMNRSVVNLLFVLKGSWSSNIYWSEQNLNELDIEKYHPLIKLMLSILKEPQKNKTEDLINRIDKLLLGEGFEFQFNKLDLIAEVVSPKFRNVRERYGTM